MPSEFYTRYHNNLHNIEWYHQTMFPNSTIQTIDITEPTDAGGHHAKIFRIALTMFDNDDDTKTIKEVVLIAKLLSESNPEQGYEREILVNQHFLAPLVEAGVINTPKLYYSDYDTTIGAKVLVLQGLNGVQCGRFFGKVSPHNHGKDLDEMTKDFPGIDAVMITQMGFCQIAQLHAKYWNIAKSDVPSYIKGVDWIIDTNGTETKNQEGKISIGEEQYNAMIGFARQQWPLRHEQRPDIKLGKYLEDIITHSLEQSTWEKFQTQLNSNPYTIIHSDFYPANTLLVQETPAESKKHVAQSVHIDGQDKNAALYILDYELTSIGSGPQDLSQWVISHLDPSLRQENEEHLLQEYYKSLINGWEKHQSPEKANEFKQSYTIDDVKRAYINGGGKWIWLIAICVSSRDQGIPDKLYQHFIDQLTHFFQTNNVSIENNNVPMPRS